MVMANNIWQLFLQNQLMEQRMFWEDQTWQLTIPLHVLQINLLLNSGVVWQEIFVGV